MGGKDYIFFKFGIIECFGTVFSFTFLLVFFFFLCLLPVCLRSILSVTSSRLHLLGSCVFLFQLK